MSVCVSRRIDAFFITCSPYPVSRAGVHVALLPLFSPFFGLEPFFYYHDS